MSEIDDISEAIAAAVGGTSGLSTTDINPPDVIAAWEFPKALVYPGRSRSRMLTYTSRGVLHTVFVDVHVNLSSAPLAATLAAARPFMDTIPDSLWAAWHEDQFGGVVANLGNPDAPESDPIRSDLAELGWGSTTTIGVRTEIDFWLEKETVV